MIPGRLVTISNGNHRNALAVILHEGTLDSTSKLISTNTTNKPLEKTYLALLLCTKTYENNKLLDASMKLDNDEIIDKEKQSRHCDIFLSKTLFIPKEQSGQVVEEILAGDIEEILNKCIKVDYTKIIENHKKRLIPRFR